MTAPNAKYKPWLGKTTYKPPVAAFSKVKDEHGEFSNMHGGFPLKVAGIMFKTSEALFQALKFGEYPHFQNELIGEASPMLVKRKASAHKNDVRADWFDINFFVMAWCLSRKYMQHGEFKRLLEETGDLPIVENLGKRQDIWGANPQADGSFKGVNMLGKLLMDIRKNGAHTGGLNRNLASLGYKAEPPLTLLGRVV